MTDSVSDLTAHISGIRQLGAVVNAMRGIAAARTQQARSRLDAVEGYSATLSAAIAQTLTLGPDSDATTPQKQTRPAIVLFCAEQGFAGAFSERVLEHAGRELAEAQLFLVGTRGARIAAERGLRAGAWIGAMPPTSDGIPRLADRIAEALYARIAAGRIDRLAAVFSRWRAGHGIRVERRPLFPLDLSGFVQPVCSPPLLGLPPDSLLSALTADYMHAQLCDTALHAFAAENQARVEAMASAHGEIERQLARLQALYNTVRQQEITAELLELAAGGAVSRLKRNRQV